MNDEELLKKTNKCLDSVRNLDVAPINTYEIGAVLFEIKARLEQKEMKMDDKEFLNDLDRGDYDASRGYPHKDGESQAYDMGYAFRYMIEQMETARSEQ
jgi:hypothetical protein